MSIISPKTSLSRWSAVSCIISVSSRMDRYYIGIVYGNLSCVSTCSSHISTDLFVLHHNLAMAHVHSIKSCHWGNALPMVNPPLLSHYFDIPGLLCFNYSIISMDVFSLDNTETDISVFEIFSVLVFIWFLKSF